MASTLRESKLRSGDALRSELCAASGSERPRRWDSTTLNRLLELADVRKEERDPLGFKQLLVSVDPHLGAIPLRPRKEMMAALASHAAAARAAGLPDRFGQWPPPEPERPPEKPRQTKEKRVDPLAGTADGYRWTQSETDLTIAVPVPAGTSKTEVMLQLTPRYGPATRIVLRTRFWPQPLVVGELHASVEASECMWHLSSDAMEVVIDLPKVETALWPAILRPLTAIAAKEGEALPPPPPVAGGVLPATSCGIAAASVAGGAPRPNCSDNGTAEVVAAAAAAASVRVDVVVQRMGQRPRELDVVRTCIETLRSALDPETHVRAACAARAGRGSLGGADAAEPQTPQQAADAAAVKALNARVVPLLLRSLKLHGQHAYMQLAAWSLLSVLMRGRQYVKRLVADAGALDLLLAGLSAHMSSAQIVSAQLRALRFLLPACPPKPFVDAGGIEVVADTIRVHKLEVPSCTAAATILQMLASLNDITRTRILELDVLPSLLSALSENDAAMPPLAEEVALAEHSVGLAAQLARATDGARTMLFRQCPPFKMLAICRRHVASVLLLANGARVLAALMVDSDTVLEFVGVGGLSLFEQAAMSAPQANDVSGNGNLDLPHEVQQLCESAIIVLSKHLGKPPPEDVEEFEERGVTGMVEIVQNLVAEAHARVRAQQEAAKVAAEAAAAEAEAIAKLEAAKLGKSMPADEEPSAYSTAFSAHDSTPPPIATDAGGTSAALAPNMTSTSSLEEGGAQQAQSPVVETSTNVDDLD